LSLDDAKEQAIREYGNLLGRWCRLPDDLEDDSVSDYVREHLLGR
jgi:hypothetical protein